jgi:hypothetical protein
MFRLERWTVTMVLLAALPAGASGAKYSIKQANTPPPSELSEPIRKLLSNNSIQLHGDKAGLLCEVWFRKEVPVKATPEQLKNGLTYREVEESTILGAIRLEQQANDYRKQKIKPGVYTLRLGFQPMDGDHMGTAPYSEFCLLVPAKLDEKADLIETKELREVSAKATGGSHPAVFLLYPNEKPEDMPKLADKGSDTWVLNVKEPITVGGQKADGGLGIGLTLIGHTSME